MADKKSSINNIVSYVNEDGKKEKKIQKVTMNGSDSSSFFSVNIAGQTIATLTKKGEKNFSLKFYKKGLSLLSFGDEFKSSEAFKLISSDTISWSGDSTISLAEDNKQQLVLTLTPKKFAKPIKIIFNAVSVIIEYDGKVFKSNIDESELKKSNPSIKNEKIVQDFELSTSFFEAMIDNENNIVSSVEKVPSYLFGKYFDLLEQGKDLEFKTKDVGQYKFITYNFSKVKYSFALITNEKGKQVPYIYHKGAFKKINKVQLFKDGKKFFLLVNIGTNKYIKLNLPENLEEINAFLQNFESNINPIEFSDGRKENDVEFLYGKEKKYVEIKDSTHTIDYSDEISSPKITLYGLVKNPMEDELRKKEAELLEKEQARINAENELKNAKKKIEELTLASEEEKRKAEEILRKAEEEKRKAEEDLAKAEEEAEKLRLIAETEKKKAKAEEAEKTTKKLEELRKKYLEVMAKDLDDQEAEMNKIKEELQKLLASLTKTKEEIEKEEDSDEKKKKLEDVSKKIEEVNDEIKNVDEHLENLKKNIKALEEEKASNSPNKNKKQPYKPKTLEPKEDTKIKIDVKSLAETFMPLFSFFMFIGAALTGGIGFLVFAILGAVSSSVLTSINGTEIKIKHSIRKLENNKYSMFRQLDTEYEKAKENYKENFKNMQSFLEDDKVRDYGKGFGAKFAEYFSDFGLEKSSKSLAERYELVSGRTPSSELLERLSNIEKITDPTEKSKEIEKIKSDLKEDGATIDKVFDKSTDFLDLGYNNIQKKVAHSLEEINNEKFADKKLNLQLDFIKTFLPGLEASYQADIISFLEGKSSIDDLMKNNAFSLLKEAEKVAKRTFFNNLKSSYNAETTKEGKQNVLNNYFSSSSCEEDLNKKREFIRHDLFDSYTPDQIKEFQQKLIALQSSGSKLLVSKEQLAQLVRDENITFLTQVFGNREEEATSRILLEEYADILTQRFILQKTNSKLPLDEFLKFLPEDMRDRARSLIIANCEKIQTSAQRVEEIVADSVSKEDNLNILKAYSEIILNIDKIVKSYNSYTDLLPKSHRLYYESLIRKGKKPREIIEKIITTYKIDGVLIKDILLAKIKSDNLNDLFDNSKNKNLKTVFVDEINALKESTNLKLSAEEDILSSDVVKAAVARARNKEEAEEKENKADEKYAKNAELLKDIEKAEKIYNKLISKLQELIGNKDKINNYEEFLALISKINNLNETSLASIGISLEHLGLSSSSELTAFVKFIKDKKILANIQSFIKNSKGKDTLAIKKAWDNANSSIKKKLKQMKNTAEKNMSKKITEAQKAGSYKKDLSLKNIKQRTKDIKKEQEEERKKERKRMKEKAEEAKKARLEAMKEKKKEKKEREGGEEREGGK